MKHCMLSAALVLCCTSVLAQGAAEENGEEGFVPLFDGKSFAGWRVDENTPKSWKIDSGLLVLTGGSSHLFTKEEFGGPRSLPETPPTSCNRCSGPWQLDSWSGLVRRALALIQTEVNWTLTHWTSPPVVALC